MYQALFKGGSTCFYNTERAESTIKPYLHKTLALPLPTYVQLGTKTASVNLLVVRFSLKLSSSNKTAWTTMRSAAFSTLFRTNTSSNRRCFSSSPVFFLPPSVRACGRQSLSDAGDQTRRTAQIKGSHPILWNNIKTRRLVLRRHVLIAEETRRS